MIMAKERRAVVHFGRRMISSRLTTGSGGNISVCDRAKGLIAVTPSGVEYDALHPADVVITDMHGTVVDGSYKPTSELSFHLSIYAARPEATAVVHTHSAFATTVACLNMELPAVHYLVGFAGKKVPLAPYATFGTPELAAHIVSTIGNEYNACLMANHGLVACGKSLSAAFATAEELELVAQIWYQAKCIGTPVIVPDDEMTRVIAKFAGYGANAQNPTA